MAARVTINRAPVLTLWGAVVAARMGYDWEEALTLGKAVAGLNAQSKGRALGIYGPPKGVEPAGQKPKKVGLGEEFWVQVVGRSVPAKRTERGVRAVVRDAPIDPQGVEKYLRGKLKDDYDKVRAAMEALAASFSPRELDDSAYELYETFRPRIPSGKRGWGATGELDLDLVRSLGRHKGA
jgi:hypothetical protein